MVRNLGLAGLALAAVVLLGVQTPAQPTFAQFSAPGADDVMDLHGDPGTADLVIFAAGNQWFVMPELMAAFKHAYPDVHNVFYETLPPGVLSSQIAGGGLQVGELKLSVHGDAVMTVPPQLTTLQSQGLVGASEAFARNELAILVRRGNPLYIESMRDLGRASVRVAMPNPKTEGIARQIESAYRKAGGEALDRTIMVTKVAAGTTIITSIHHRETPAWLLSNKVDAGPVWISEAIYQEKLGTGLLAVRIPANENDGETYVAAAIDGAPHPVAAREYLAFLRSPAAQAVYRSYGFSIPAVSTTNLPVRVDGYTGDKLVQTVTFGGTTTN
jgi:molybdate transport system substrate-binding protein